MYAKDILLLLILRQSEGLEKEGFVDTERVSVASMNREKKWRLFLISLKT